MTESKKNQGMLTIGRLAKRVDVNVETIRYYQRIGLIDEPATPLIDAAEKLTPKPQCAEKTPISASGTVVIASRGRLNER